MGSLAEGDFDSVWNGRKYRALRRSVNTKPDSICHDCRMPSHEAEEGRVAGELRPSMKQLVVQFGQSLKTRQSVRFTDVLDPRFDPRHPGPAA
jgi:hypothetical protein